MYKFVVLAALVACVAADAPTSYARGEPLGLAEYNAPAATFSSSSGSSSQGYSSGGSSDGAQLDEGLLRQVSQILSQGGSSGSSQGYSAPALAPQQPQYSAPQQGGYSSGPSRSTGGAVQLGRIEVAQRVAEFDLSSNSGARQSQSYGAPAQSGGY